MKALTKQQIENLLFHEMKLPTKDTNWYPIRASGENQETALYEEIIVIVRNFASRNNFDSMRTIMGCLQDIVAWRCITYGLQPGDVFHFAISMYKDHPTTVVESSSDEVYKLKRAKD